MKIASLVSGGVDSSVTVHLLKEQGYDPHIFYIKIGLEDDPDWMDCPSAEDIEITTFIAKKYGCKFDVISLQDEYWDRVISYTIDSVKSGLTPNPDVMCNKMIKFGAFEEKYGKDFDFISTGHYATTLNRDGVKYLGTAKDSFKDQTYFLGQISQAQLDKLVFPIGGLLNRKSAKWQQKQNYHQQCARTAREFVSLEKSTTTISSKNMLAKNQVKSSNLRQAKYLVNTTDSGFTPSASAKDLA